MVKKVLAGIFSLVFMLNLGNYTAVNAADEEDYMSLFKFTYDLDEDGNAIITGSAESDSGALMIPSELEGHKVIGIGDGAFKKRNDISYLAIAEGIEFIGDSAFENCATMQYSGLPTTLKSIGDSAFAECGYNQSVYLRSGIEYIGKNAFKDNIALYTVYFDVDRDSNLELSSSGIFEGCTLLHDLVLGDELDYIGKDVFLGCDSITNIRYEGTADQFNSLLVASGNDSLKDATVYCEFNKEKGVIRTSFDPSKDIYSFSNEEVSNLYGAYSLDKKYKDILEYKLNDAERISVNQLLGQQSDGYCYGIALTSKLLHEGYIDASELTPGATSAIEIDMNNTVFKNTLNYYMILQQVPIRINKQFTDIVSQERAFDNLVKTLVDGETSVVTYTIAYVNSDGDTMGAAGHAVLAYGIEYGEYIIGDKVYNGKILIYDSNSPDLSDDYNIYFNTELFKADGDLEDGAYIVKAYEQDFEEYGIKTQVLVSSTIDDTTLLNYKGLYENLEEEYEWDSKNTYKIGDVNLDGSVSVSDVIYLQRYILAIDKFKRENFYIADMNGDSSVNIFDLALLKRELINNRNL